MRRLPRHALCLAIAAVLAAVPAPLVAEVGGVAPEPGGRAPAAYTLEAGSYARDRVVVLGRDLLVAGDARSHAVAIDGSVRVEGRVGGDVLVLGGDATLAPGSRVDGDVFVLGGTLSAAAGAEIGGRSVAYPDASRAWVTLAEGPALGLPATAPVVIGAKLALLAFWGFLAVLLLAVGRRELLATSASVREEPFRNFFVGLTGILAMVLTGLLFSAFSGSFLGLPLLVLVAVVALVLRFWGMVAVFHALGDVLSRRFGHRALLPATAATCGLLVLGVVKMVPWLGVWVWSLATFIGVGAALSTKLGRREPWLA